MPILSRITGTIRSLIQKNTLDREFDAELESYVQLLADEMVRRGLSPEEALRKARIEVGASEYVKQRVREERLGAGLDTFLFDLRFALRSIRKSPGFTTIVVLILAIGIGSNTALFSTVNAVLLRNLPYAKPDRLVVGFKTIEGQIRGPVSRPDYYDFHDRNVSFEHFAMMGNFSSERVLLGGERPKLVNQGFASWNLFQTLGIHPVAGRGFVLEDEQIGESDSVLISHGFWQSQFGGSANAIGAPLRISDTAYTVVGVLPQGFRFLYDIDVWSLVDRQGPIDIQRDSHSMLVVGRLKPGVSIERAQGDVDVIAAALREEYPDTNDSKGLWLGDLHGAMVRNVSTNLVLLMATTVLVLLIACANVAGLLLARGQRRLPEMAMRASLGAPRSRLIRQLLIESLVTTVIAGAAGIGVAHLFQSLLLRLLSLGATGIDTPRFDGSAIAFATTISVVTALLVAIVPALRSTSAGPSRQLAAGTRVSEGLRGVRLRSGLVIGQVAISILLLIGSALLIRSLGQLLTVDLGFDSGNLLTARVQIQADDHTTAEERSLLFASLLERVRAMPGVESASAISRLPILNRGQDWPLWRTDQPRPAPTDTRFAMARWVAPEYFATIGIPLIRGRSISSEDRPDTARVVVLSESVARSLFGEEEAIGRQVGIGWEKEPWQVVGIVSDARINNITMEPYGAMYMSSAQAGATQLALAVRTSAEPMSLASPIRTLLHELDPNAVISGETTMDSILDSRLSGFRAVIVSLGLFSVIALTLTAIGLYGLLAYHISQRFREIGIRMALGAAPARLVRGYVGRGFVLIAGGLLLGLVCALPCSRLMADLLFEVEPFDPASYFGAFVFLAFIGFLACLLPSLRAIRVNPANLLRVD